MTGEDTPDYLQSQFTNDLAKSTPGSVTYGLWLDRKGKVAADSFVFHLADEEYLLLSYFCPAAEIIAKLESNIIADEVELEDVTEGGVLVLELNGDTAQLPAEGRFEPQSPEAADGLRFAGRCAQGACETLWLKEAPAGVAALAEADPATIAYLRIAACIPAVPQDIGPGDLPQEGGLEKHAVSFNKGCYLGQEVMARLHAMGKTTRALCQVELEKLPDEPLPLAITDAEGKAVGELRSAAAGEGRVLGLAMFKRRALESGGTFSLSGMSLIIVLKPLA